MINFAAKTVIFLDMVLLVMTASWVLFGVSKGIDEIELFYNYIYVLVALFACILNIWVIKRK